VTNLAKECADTRTPDPNSALLRFPSVAQAGLPVPRTKFVQYEPSWLWSLLDGEAPAREFRMEELVAACEKIGYPCSCGLILRARSTMDRRKTGMPVSSSRQTPQRQVSEMATIQTRGILTSAVTGIGKS
jgi:hypothetical protein